MIYMIYNHIYECWALHEKKQITIKVTKINNAKVDVGDVTRLVSIRNEYIKRSLEIMNTAGKWKRTDLNGLNVLREEIMKL